ncbi:MAG: hypothetical protein JEZ07_05820 [Phycisphaerae bacterium]|nr:hypothetical protein [Phycisphaerae bacterium]
MSNQAHWDYLVRDDLQRNIPFFHSIRSPLVKVKHTEMGYELRHSAGRYLAAIVFSILFCLVVWVTLMAFLKGKERPYVLLFLGLVLGGNALRYLNAALSAGRIVLDESNGKALFYYGNVFRRYYFCLDSKDLSVRLWNSNALMAENLNVVPGVVILSLKYNGVEKVLLANIRRKKIIEMYNAFVDFLGHQHCIDESLCPVEFPDGQIYDIPVGPAVAVKTIDVFDRRYQQKGDYAIFKAGLSKLYIPFFVNLLLLLMWFVIFVLEKGSFWYWVLVGICGTAQIMIFYLWYHSIVNEYIVADKRRGALFRRAWLIKYRGGKKLLNLYDIVAVQVCYSLGDAGVTGNRQILEMNVILSDSNRINVYTTRKLKKFKSDVKRFADFLNVPILDGCCVVDEI